VTSRARLALFVAALVGVFGLGWGAGAAVGPLGEDPPAGPTTHHPAVERPRDGQPVDVGASTTTVLDHVGHEGAHP
jgi:hypothetical protein